MSDIVDSALRNAIGKRLVNRLGVAIERHEIEAENITAVSEMIIPVLETMQSSDELVAFFQKLSLAWPFFEDVIEGIPTHYPSSSFQTSMGV